IPPILYGLGLTSMLWDWLAWLSYVGEVLWHAHPLVAMGDALYGDNRIHSPWLRIGTFTAAYATFSILVLTWSILSLRRVYRKSIGSSPPARRRFLSRRRWRPQLGNLPMLWKELFAETAAIHLGRTGQIALLLLFAAAV